MLIERIELDGFGRFHDAHWPLGDGLTVLLGANEAGKTTLLNALRALLFGFEATRDGRTWYPPFAGGRRGGRLALRTGSGERWTVERHGERGGGGALAVRAPNGNQGGQETLDRLLHGADKDLFNNIFAFGLGELQTFASLSAEGVRGRIYGAGAGLGGTSAIDLERRLRQQLDGLFLPRGSQRPMNQLLGRIEELRREIADLARQPEEHAAATRERDELRARADALRSEAAEARERLARIRQLRDAGPIAIDLRALEADLADGDESLDAMPEDAVGVLDARAAELAEARAVLTTLDEDLDETRHLRAGVTLDPAVIEVADEIVAVAAERARPEASEPRRQDLAAAVARQEAVVAEQLARAGGWDEARLVRLDDSIPAVEATREYERGLAATESARGAAEQRRRSVADELASLSGAGEDRAAVGADLDARLAALRELDGIGQRPPGASLGRPVAAGLAVLAGLVVALLGLLASAPLPGVAGGVLVAGVVYLLLSRRPVVTSGAPSELLARAGLPSDAGPPQIGAARDELAAARARRDLATENQARLSARRAELESRERELERALSERTAAARAWADWLDERGLPGGVSPDAARHLLGAAGTARRAAMERDHHRQELAALAADDEAVSARTDALLVSLGIEAGGTDAQRDARAAATVARLERARAEERRARELDDRSAQLERRRAPAHALVEEREAAVRAHLAAIGCPDPDQLRRRAGAAAQRRALRAQVRDRRAQLALIAGGGSVDELLREATQAKPPTLDAAESTERETLERHEADERAATSRAGALEARIHQLEAAEELGARRQELAVLEGRLATMAHEWAVTALALKLLEETRSRYERERQPDVVRAAEQHFERITGGRYARIVAPPGDASVRVETEGGESRVTEELSRGTGEQLYLALRFGLIEEFARHAEPLPVVMDDILVNFDAERAARAASAIRDLAERHQVLYFTCHPWTAELLDPDGVRTVALG